MAIRLPLRVGTAALGAALISAGCATGRAVAIEALPGYGCAAADRAVAWYGPTVERDRRKLLPWCESVGVPVIRVPATAASVPGTSAPASAVPGTSLTLVTWNLHEAAGDIARLVSALPPGPVVILVQEAMRRSEAVPPAAPRGVHVPRREGRADDSRDIVAAADALGMWLAYVPSMRNGEHSREDRGCAILSTLPLRDPIAIELPWVRQRRVAVMATVDANIGGAPLRVVSAHLDNRPGREQQAEALARWLRPIVHDAPLVVGADLNTWFGPGERTVDHLRAVVPRVDECGDRPTFRFGRRLDYLFTTLPADVRAGCEVMRDTFGSDHHPVRMHVR